MYNFICTETRHWVVFFFSIIIGYFILLPDQFLRFAYSGLSQIALISNFHFWHYYHFSYMADSALKLPFLHTWSLSVEEQFYIIAPIVIFTILKYLKKYLKFFLIFGVILSLAAANYTSQKFTSFGFYMLPFRVWEFLIGSLVAYNEIFLKPKKGFFGFFFNCFTICHPGHFMAHMKLVWFIVEGFKVGHNCHR